MGGCVLAARLSMKADILKPLGGDEGDTPTPENPGIGHWEYSQDPDSGAIERQWVTDVVDDPDTPDVDESTLDFKLTNVPCQIRGIMQGGIRVAGTTQRFSEIYENVEWANATFPKNVTITKNDKVTNVRNQHDVLIWINEETSGAATTFDVMGVTPVLDPFGNLVEWTALLQRSEIQYG